MNDHELEPFSDDVLAALATLPVTPLPPGVAEAVLVKVKVSAGLAVASATVAGSAGSAQVAAKAGASALLKVLPAVTLATGIGLGVAADRLVLRPTEVVERVVVQRVEVAPPVEPVVAPPEPKPAPKAPPKKATDTLGRERVMLDVARSALAANDTAKALSAVEAHEAQFPMGQLLEEREALAVQVLVRAGQRERAQRRFASFVAKFPDSPLRGALEALVR